MIAYGTLTTTKSVYGRHADTAATPAHHAKRRSEAHRARAGRKARSACTRVPIPITSPRLTRSPGCCSSSLQDGDLCERLLLARSFQMSEGQTAEEPPRILGAQDRAEQGTRRCSDPKAKGDGVVCIDGLAMSDARRRRSVLDVTHISRIEYEFADRPEAPELGSCWMFRGDHGASDRN